ncbi:MAG: Rieske (2Fe-2S) protein [bacterium]
MTDDSEPKQAWLMPELARPDWFLACLMHELQEGRGKTIEVGNRPIALFLLAGEVFAIDSRCTHAGAPLGSGWLDGAMVVCPLHRWKFDIRTGQCRTDPRQPVRSYRVEARKNGEVWVRITE